MSSKLFANNFHQEPKVIWLLRILTFAVFAGRGWQHLFWDAPFRTILWDESILKPLVESISDLTWNEYVTSEVIDLRIQIFIKALGVCYLILAILSLLIKSSHKKSGYLLIVGTSFLTLLALLYFKEKFFQVGQFFEYSAQFITPLLLYISLYSKVEVRKFTFLIKVAIALTFICHGLYAAGFYPRPGNFVDMTINILGVSETSAHTMLWYAGIIDFIVAIAIFIPFVDKAALIYAVIWGFSTSIARVWANFDVDFTLLSLHQWLFETVFRLPHGGLPLLILFLEGVYTSKLFKHRFVAESTTS
ncbi:MAG: hypothetical protein AAFN93_00635 [Bacteroidota bacterium]